MMYDAYSLLTQAIEAAPQRPSCYNNRAQILRLQGRSDEALLDLDKALGLSGARGRTGSQALVQRASIHRKDGREDDAIADFRVAIQYHIYFKISGKFLYFWISSSRPKI